MAYDEGLAEIQRADLDGLDGIAEKRMFGGLAFLWHGHMLCGVHPGGATYRVGAENDAAAQAMAGVRAMDFTGRPMKGWVDVAPQTLADDRARARLLGFARATVEALPPK